MSDPLGLLEIARSLLQSRLRLAWSLAAATIYALGVWLPLLNDLARAVGEPWFTAPLTTPLSTLHHIVQWLGLPAAPLSAAEAWTAARADLIGNAAALVFWAALIISSICHAAVTRGPLPSTLGLSAAILVQIGWAPWQILASIILAITIAGTLPGKRGDRMGLVFMAAVVHAAMPLVALFSLLFLPSPDPDRTTSGTT